ncbi:MAG: PhoH family protein [Oscillospiraceae bacterium]|nr:PhoH family protein [Oscillospiraceae bacterium]
MADKIFEALTNDIALLISGPFNKNIQDLEKAFGVSIVCRGTEFKIMGEDENVRKALTALNTMTDLHSQGTALDDQSVHYCINMAQSGDAEKVKNMHSDLVLLTAKGKPIRSKTLGQTEYLRAISKNSITFGIGPAGTGKTYLAVAMAVKAFKSGQVSRIILTRPAVEAGEKLGFLPGDLQNKVDPYLRPLYDGLFDMIGPETFQKLMEKGVIEVAPLAYMRGRTLDDSFIILDEAQNTTKEQMKMFLTRMGNGSKIVVTGDVTQIDLPSDKKSGLKDAISILRNIDDIAIIRLSEKDVVRHKLVQDIVKAYEKAADEKNDKPPFNPNAYKRGKFRYVK